MAKKLNVKYRRKGEVVTLTPSEGVRVFVLDEDRYTPVEVPDDQLPEQELDLTRVPVIQLGGRHASIAGARQFLSGKADFNGAFVWGCSQVNVLVTEPEILKGHRVSGGRPEEQWVNHRFLRDGSYIADRATVLHGKTLKVLREAVEQDAGPEKLAQHLAQRWRSSDHSVAVMATVAIEALQPLCTRRQYETGESVLASTLVQDFLCRRFEALGIVRASQIPADFSFSVADAAPELWAQRDTIGMRDIPGVGMVELTGRQQNYPVITLTIAQVATVSEWPFSNFMLVVAELSREPFGVYPGSYDSIDRNHPLFQEGEGRWPMVRAAIAERWMTSQRHQGWPKNQPVGHPRDADPQLPSEVQWGTSLDGEALVAYPALAAPRSPEENGWEIKWYPSREEAEQAHRDGMLLAGGYIRQRKSNERVLAALAAGESAEGDEVSFPVEIPQKPEGLEWSWSAAVRGQYERQLLDAVAALLNVPQAACLPAETLRDLRSDSDYRQLSGLLAAVEQWSKAVRLYAARQAAVARGELRLDVAVDVSSESRANTLVWAIAAGGEVLPPLGAAHDGCKGRVSAIWYGDLPASALVLSRTDDDYGYRYTETWTVECLPCGGVTPAQRAKAAQLAAETAIYFRAEGESSQAPTWDLSQEGTVAYTTEYSRDFWGDKREAFDALRANFPIDPREYRCRATQELGRLTIEVTTEPRRVAAASNPILIAMQDAGLVDEEGNVVEMSSGEPDEGADDALRSARDAWGEIYGK